MESPSAGWHVDPDPLPNTHYPVRWWDGERWGDEQAWFSACGRSWVAKGARGARYNLLALQHPWLMALGTQGVGVAPFLVLIGPTWTSAFLVGWALLLGLVTGFQYRRPGKAPTSPPPPPVERRRPRHRRHRILEA